MTAALRRKLAADRRAQQKTLAAQWEQERRANPNAVCLHRVMTTDAQTGSYVCVSCGSRWPMATASDDPVLKAGSRRLVEAYFGKNQGT